jgi:cytochrome c biogenesis protein CcdA
MSNLQTSKRSVALVAISGLLIVAIGYAVLHQADQIDITSAFYQVKETVVSMSLLMMFLGGLVFAGGGTACIISNE